MRPSTYLRVKGVSLLLLICFMFHPVARGAANPNDEQSATSSPSTTWSASFAIADLDGDQKPDFATIGIQRLDSVSAHYLVRLQLTSEPGQWIRVTGAPGLPRIVARDVNGDNVQDLVVSTTGQSQPIAVFLNDGHGNFRRATPTEFSAELSNSPTRFIPLSREVRDAGVLVPSRTSLAECNFDIAPFSPQRVPGSSLLAYQGFLSNPIYSSTLSRAPPSLA